mmetsp:Transcript_22596/g.38766  ORF Transcript_22596/g.38766 Transcript_22596/m.38766 type:complete len:522 (+) Transcript_22596:100-1665(+)
MGVAAAEEKIHIPQIKHDSQNGLPDLTNEDAKLKDVRKGYFSREWSNYAMCGVGVVLVALCFRSLLQINWKDFAIIRILLETHVVNLLLGVMILTCLTMFYLLRRKRPVYLIDFAVFKPDISDRCSNDEFVQKSQQSGFFTEDSLAFQRKIMANNGVGNDTYLPPGVRAVPPECTMQNARDEAALVLFGCIDEVLKRTGISPKQIDILVLNCSLFNPTPSLTAMIINKYKLRSNILSFNLSGMGCSANPISVGLARDLLQVYAGSYALVLSTENITQNWYFGNEKSMLIPNTLFRMGGACMLLSNKFIDRFRAKYQLLHVVRTHKGANDSCYYCVYQKEDSEGFRGVHLSKDLMQIAADALKQNITTLGPLILPLSEQLKFFINLCRRRILKQKLKPYIPNFKKAVQHFCIHAGGRGVIDALEKNLSLDLKDVEPSRQTLWRFGNTSSSSIWYELLYSEVHRGVRRGDRVWQIAFGSGFKCNSAVWKSLRWNKRELHEWPACLPEKVSATSLDPSAAIVCH